MDEADYQKLNAMKSINAVPTTCPRTGKTIYRIKDVIGVKDGLGVENLSGSGLIAGQMSASYAQAMVGDVKHGSQTNCATQQSEE